MDASSVTLPTIKRTRAKGPKVKTGCGTCKIRHLKCDEGKPICQRCIKDARKCDGYDQPKARKVRANKTFQMIPFVPKPDRLQTIPLPAPRPALVSDIFIELADAALYFHARDCAINDFESIAGSNGFWHSFVLPLSHTVKPIKHALCALGGAHRVFMAAHPDASASRMELESIQKYNEAILHMRPIMEEGSKKNLEVTIICCLLFICIESLHGRYVDAARHLQAGCQLVNSYRRELYSGSNISHAQHDSFLNLVTDMMHWFGQNLGLYKGDLGFVAIDRDIQPSDIGNSSTPFASIKEANRKLASLESMFDNCMVALSKGTSPHDQSGFYEQAFSEVGCIPFDFGSLRSATQSTRDLFKVWSARCDLLKATIDPSRLSLKERRELALVSLNQAMWAPFLKLESVESEYSIEDSNLILDQVEELFKMEEAKSRRVFTFDGDLVSSTSIVCSSCRDPQVLERGAALLRALNRREGVWDSKQMADLHDAISKAVEEERVVWHELPWGIPQMIEEIAKLKL